MTEKQFLVELPEKLGFLISDKSRYKVLHGGRGSSKSWSIARALLVKGLHSKLRILCTREVQKSIKDSVHRLLTDQIDTMKFSDYYEVTREEIRGRRNGTCFLFAGLSDNTAETIKSFEGVDICWVEEAQTVSERSWSILIPTIRGSGSEIWVSFNPNEHDDPTYQRFVLKPPPDAIVCQINWEDNPWFPEELRKEKDYLYSVDPELAAHVWGGGVRRVSDAQILRGRYRVQDFEAKPGLWDGPYHGIDFGFAQDPGVMIRCWIWEQDLYIDFEAWGLEIETDLLPSLWDGIPGARNYLARADCSRPETISQVRRLGYSRVIACQKWAGCEKDGIEFLRSFRHIIVHPRCPETAREFRLWSWRRDRLSGDILPLTTGKYDNAAAALRYALEPLIMGHTKKEAEKPPTTEEEFPGMHPPRPRAHGWMA